MTQFAPVSVIVPCYNSENTLTRAFDSILSQTILPKEIIFINDASTDGTAKLLEKFRKDHPDLVKVINFSTNRGVANARNAAWDASTQAYIAFLDSDDSWESRKIEIQYDWMKKNPQISLCGHLCYVQIKQDQIHHSQLEIIKSTNIGWWALLLRNHFITPSIMLKADIPLRFDSANRYVDDHLLWLEIIAHGYKVANLNVKLAFIYKPLYGASGLSAKMWLMEKAELSNYKKLYQKNYLNLFECYFLQFFSIAKFIRRLFIVYVYRYSRKIIRHPKNF